MPTKWWTLVAVCTGTFMLLLDVTIVQVALPSIESAFHAQLSDLQWVLDAYALSLAALLLTAGSLADLFGRRIVFAIGTAIFTLGSFACGIATDPLFLILARALQGVGGATMFATGLALIAHAFRGRERGTVFGIYGAVTGVAVAVGPVLGGVITSGIGWRWIFFVNLPIGVAAIAITLGKVEESKDPRGRRPDWVGFATFTFALGLLVFGLIRSNTEGWSSPVVYGCIVGAAIVFIGFVVAERRQSTPMFPFALLSKPTFTGGLISAFTLSASIFSLLTYIILYLQNVLGLSALQTGVRFLYLSGAIFVVAAIAGRATSLIPTRIMIGVGFLGLGAGMALMRGIATTTHWSHLIPGLIVAGVGTGLVSVPLASTAIGVVESNEAGVASGINSTFRQVGFATGIAALGSILASSDRHTITALLNPTPVRAYAAQIAAGATNATDSRRALPSALGQYRGVIVHALDQGYVHALNEILLIGVVIALIGALAAFVLIRQRDFVAGAGVGGEH